MVFVLLKNKINYKKAQQCWHRYNKLSRQAKIKAWIDLDTKEMECVQEPPPPSPLEKFTLITQTPQ